MQSNKLVQKGKPAVAGTSPDLTISVSAVGAVTVSPGSTTPNSLVHVQADEPFSAVCIRKGMTFDADGAILNGGTCMCATVIANPGAPHLTSSPAAYVVKAGAGGDSGADYKVIGIKGAIPFGNSGDIHVGTDD